MRFFSIAQSPKSCAIVMRSHLTLAAHRKSKVVLSDFYYVASEAYLQQSPKIAKKKGFFTKEMQRSNTVVMSDLHILNLAISHTFTFLPPKHCSQNEHIV